MCGDDGIEITFAAPGIDMLVDRGIGKQSEARLMTGRHHDSIVAVRIIRIPWRTPNKKRSLNGRARRTTANHATTCQQGFHLMLDGSTEVGVGQPPLASTLNPHARRMSQRFNKVLRVCTYAVSGMQHSDVLYAESG